MIDLAVVAAFALAYLVSGVIVLKTFLGTTHARPMKLEPMPVRSAKKRNR